MFESTHSLILPLPSSNTSQDCHVFKTLELLLSYLHEYTVELELLHVNPSVVFLQCVASGKMLNVSIAIGQIINSVDLIHTKCSDSCQTHIK